MSTSKLVRFLFISGVLSLAATAAPAAAQVCVSPPTGLVGWWPAEGSAADVIAGNNGQLVGDATFAAGRVGLGFKLDGVGDHVEIPDSLALKPARVSVEAWVRFDSLNTPIVSQFGALGQQYIVFKKNSRVFNFEAYSLHKQRTAGIDRFAFRVADSTGIGGQAESTTAIAVGQLYHVVGTYDGTSAKLYVNGVLENQVATSVTIDYGTRPVFIGTSGETVFDGKLNGIVDEASIYNRGLSASEVAALFTAGAAGKCASATGLLTNLISFVQTLNLASGIANSLDAKLQSALLALDDANAGHVVSACGRIGAFLNQVDAQSGKTLTPSEAQQLTSVAQQAQSALNCR